MSGRTPLVLPHPRRRARQDARLAGAWLFRDPASPPLSAPPTLRTLVGTDFMDAFLRGVDRARTGWDPACWAPLLAYRDWSEPPRAARDALGRSELPPSLQRRAPLPGELDRQDGADLASALAGERDVPGWIRKLYLPLHRHFSIITTELLCDSIGLPPIDPARVVEVGCVVRRLILDPNAERWEDWVVAPDGGGRWAELGGLDAGGALDPRALPAGATYEGRADPVMRTLLGVTDVTTPLSLGITPMVRLPPTLGEARRHTAHYALLPVMTREQQRPEPEPRDQAEAQQALVAQSFGRLMQIFTGERGEALNERIGGLWRTLVVAVERLDVVERLTPEELTPLCPPAGWTQWMGWKGGVVGLATLGPKAGSAPSPGDVFTVLWQLGRARKELRSLFLPVISWDDGALLAGLGSELEFMMNRLERRPVNPAAPASEPGDASDTLTLNPELRWLAVHRAGRAVEEACEDLLRAVDAAGAPVSIGLDRLAEITALNLARERFEFSSQNFRTGVELLAAFGVDLDGALARVLLAFPLLPVDRGTANDQKFKAEATSIYIGYLAVVPEPVPADLPAAALRPPLPRFDPDHVYTARCFARIRGADPCEADQIVWSARTEPYQIADAMDLLGLPPLTMRLPDIPKMIADIPRIARARATPMLAVTTPRGSGFSTGKEPDETRRSWGVAWVCSFGIPVFTICAWVLFLIIFSILILIPGFVWMLLLKLCLPLPVPKRA